MACYYPIHGYRSKSVNDTGKRSVVFKQEQGFHDLPVTLACGRCHGCRLERSRQWAIRCLHESQLWPDNIFVTLTYDEQNLPNNNSLVKSHHQDFIKRLRKKYCPQIDPITGKTYYKKIRYYHCGEYGEETHRPHYHTLIFNHDFEDKQLYSERQGQRLYVSEALEKLWGKGFCTIGEVTFESAAYVARYIMKKINGEDQADHYLALEPITGEIHPIIPEYTTMSRRPGIGAGWYKKYKTDVYPHDYVVVNGKKMKPPRYYDSLLESDNKGEFDKLKSDRRKAALLDAENQTYERLIVREKVSKARMNPRGQV